MRPGGSDRLPSGPPAARPAPPAADTWDCHVHVFEPATPFAPLRAYTPEPAPVAALVAHLARVGASRAVLVQATPHGDDNTGVLAALDRLGPRHRAVIAPADELDAGRLARLRASGVRGLRLNPMGRIERADAPLRARLARAARLAADAGLSLEIAAAARAIEELGREIAALPCPLVLPHLADLAAPGLDDERRRRLVDMLARNGVWVKLSGLDRYDADAAGRAARLLVATMPERLVWGTDWPHTPLHDGTPVRDDRTSPPRAVDDTAAKADLTEILGPEAARVFVHNAGTLYG